MYAVLMLSNSAKMTKIDRNMSRSYNKLCVEM